MDLLTQAELAVQQGEYARAVGMVHAALPGIANMGGSSDVDRFWATVRRVTGVQSTSGHWKFTVWSCSGISEEDARFVVRFARRLKR